MKIRLLNDSIRIRLTQIEVETLAAGGAVESVTPLPGEAFTCVLQPGSGPIELHHAAGRLSVLLDAAQTKAWAGSSEEGMYSSGENLAVRVAIEKDYRCIHKPDSPDNAGTFPNPAATITAAGD